MKNTHNISWRTILLLIALFFALSLTAQENAPENKLILKITPSDTSTIDLTLKSIIDSLRREGFYAASIDQLDRKDTIYYASIFLGKAYDAFQISNGNIPEIVLKKTGLDRLLSRPLTYFELQFTQEVLLEYAENNGHPFASTQLEAVSIEGQTVRGKLVWKKGQSIRLAGIKIEENEPVGAGFLENYTGLKKGNLYQKEKIIAASQKIQQLAFVREIRSPFVQFRENEARIHFFLEARKASRFDFLIGVLPNNQETGKTLITGNVDAAFQNQFGKGEQFSFQFEQLRPETQQLELAVNYPYLFNMPLGFDLRLGLFKRDSTYRDLIWNIGVQYLFAGNHYLKAFSKNISSTLLTIDEQSIIQNKKLTDNLDVRNAYFGLEYHREKLDYRFNPRRGWLLRLSASAGFKTIAKNGKIVSLSDTENPDFSFATLYEALDLNTFQYQVEAQIDQYLPIQKRSALKLSVQAAAILSKSPILVNEQFRIGGNRLLRGFDESSIFATSYALSTLEYRYLIGQRSYFFLFGDFAYLKNKTIETDFFDWPMGIGAGMAFETKAGIFGISYALGKLQNQAFEFRSAKIHFGFISLF